MNRINQVSKLIQKTTGVDDSISWLHYDEYFFDEDTNKLRKELRVFLENEIKPMMIDYVEKAEFPTLAVEKLKQFDLLKHYISQPYGNGQNTRTLIALILELGRVDASLATFFLVQTALLTNTIDDFGSDFQKSELLPKLRNLELIGGWGLTEKDIGSDASSLETECYKDENGDWILNGNKRWIGNANKDLMVVFARDKTNQQVQGLIVFLNQEGVTRSPIKNKLALRSVQNMQIDFTNVRVQAKWRLPKVNGFQDVAKMLGHSRLYVGWLAVAIGLGVYDNVYKYIQNRTQFKKSLGQFQLIQEKLVRIMGNIQASWGMMQQLTILKEKNNITIGKLGLGKAWVSKSIREAAALGREMLGGNGIVSDYHLMRAFCDMEAIYTYEGSYDINVLVTGRELTGFSSFK